MKALNHAEVMQPPQIRTGKVLREIGRMERRQAETADGENMGRGHDAHPIPAREK